MATEFIHTSFFNKSVVITSEARYIAVTTSEEMLQVSLECSGVTFFTVDLYAYGGIVELIDPGNLIEKYFIANQMAFGLVSVTFGPVSKNIMFLFCENDMPASFNANKVMLLSSLARRVHVDSMFTVAAIHLVPNEPFVIKAVGHDCAGQIASVCFGKSDTINVQLYSDFSVDSVVRKATGQSVPVFGPLQDSPLEDVIYFSVEDGGRQLMCYISPSPAYLTFRFRNTFNVPELIDIEGSMVTKSETSRKDAVCGGDIVKYDRRTDRTYQVSTGPLPSDEVESLAQLLSSHALQVYADGIYHDAVIEEYTFEHSSDDEAITSVKFTWRFKGRRPVIFNSPLFGIQPSKREIFSDQYSPEYE